jgi:hypothetical protein
VEVSPELISRDGGEGRTERECISRKKEEIRRVIYTTNAIEPVHYPLRKVTVASDGAINKIRRCGTRQGNGLPIKGLPGKRWSDAFYLYETIDGLGMPHSYSRMRHLNPRMTCSSPWMACLGG